MRALFKLILWLVFLSPFALAAAAWFALSDQALVLNDARLSHQDIARAQAVLKNNDPRRLPAGSEQQILLSERDLNLAANYLLQKVTEGGAQVRIHPGFIDAVGTLRIPGLPTRQFLNVSLQVEDANGQPQVSSLQLGELNIPAPLAKFALTQALARLYRTHEYQLASNVVQKLAMQRGNLQVTYKWDPELIKRARSTLLSGADTEAVAAYHDKLVALQAQGIGRNGSLPELLKPLFAFARERSRNGDAVAENRALLTVLGSWASRRGLEQLVPDAAARPKSFRMKLEGRTDFGQHFLTSAALAAQGDSALADAVGLFKEIADADGGSGFSFTDIAADRAGTRFGELAARSEADARRVQQLLADGVGETDIMPRARDLPEHMNAAEFERRFGGVGSEAYKQVMADIEQRIAACRIHRS